MILILNKENGVTPSLIYLTLAEIVKEVMTNS